MEHPQLDDVVYEAIRTGHTVELTEAENYGFQIEIDGTPLLATGDGISRESFGYPLDKVPINEGADELAEEMIRSRDRHGNRNRMRRLRTSDHCATHGEVLPIDA